MVRADVAIIGGSGFYSLFSPDTPGHVATVSASTPYGSPSGDIEVAEVDGVLVAFLPRHGPGHRYPAHRIPYRANMRALADLGVRQVIAPCATGSLRRQTPPGSLVVPDQLVDQTHARDQTFYDEFEGTTFHAQFAEPYCQRLRQKLVDASRTYGWPAHDGGALVVIEGPRFSTRAETQWYASAGWALVNMTGYPEAVLSRELGMCHASLALVTNYSANLLDGPGVSEAEVYRLFQSNTERLRGLLLTCIAGLGDPTACTCSGG